MTGCGSSLPLARGANAWTEFPPLAPPVAVGWHPVPGATELVEEFIKIDSIGGAWPGR